MRYFENCKTCEDVKQLYKKYARDLHPDCNPGRNTTAEFQEMSRQYEEAYNRLKNIHQNANGETYEKESQQTATEYADLINQLLHLSGLMIERCGSPATPKSIRIHLRASALSTPLTSRPGIITRANITSTARNQSQCRTSAACTDPRDTQPGHLNRSRSQHKYIRGGTPPPHHKKKVRLRS